MTLLTIPKRNEKRSRVFLAAEVHSASGSLHARIRDISRNGALVECDDAPATGDRVQLICGTTRLEARVAWSDRYWFGVEFMAPLMVSKLVDPTGSKLKVCAPRSYRSGEPLD